MRPSRYALSEYKQVNVDAGAAYADPHALISMLLGGVQERIAIAKGAMARKDHAEKGEAIGRAMDIISYLQSCLDLEKGGELAANLDKLYAYLVERLFYAGAKNDPDILDEINGLVRQIKSGWDEIRKVVVHDNSVGKPG
jgi:flagellar protein FliS